MCFLNFHTHRLSFADETVVCSCQPAEFPLRLEAASAAGRISEGATFFSVGIHPWKAGEISPSDWAGLERALSHPAVVAVGEAGLDACCVVPLAVQQEVFYRQVILSEKMRKPLFLHCVRRVDDVLAVRRRTEARQPWIWHGFRGGPRQMEQLLKQDFYFSFGTRYRPESLKLCPADRMLLETDEAGCSVRSVYEAAAGLRGCSPGQLLHRMRENFHVLFSRCNTEDYQYKNAVTNG